MIFSFSLKIKAKTIKIYTEAKENSSNNNDGQNIFHITH